MCLFGGGDGEQTRMSIDLIPNPGMDAHNMKVQFPGQNDPREKQNET